MNLYTHLISVNIDVPLYKDKSLSKGIQRMPSLVRRIQYGKQFGGRGNVLGDMVYLLFSMYKTILLKLKNLNIETDKLHLQFPS